MSSIVERLTEGMVNRDMRAEGHALLSKWQRTGLLEGLGDDRKKQGMARLLENQAKELLRESSSMAGGDVNKSDIIYDRFSECCVYTTLFCLISEAKIQSHFSIFAHTLRAPGRVPDKRDRNKPAKVYASDCICNLLWHLTGNRATRCCQ